MSDLLTKIGNLLRQAEGTDNEHEAEAFLRRAQALATQSSIDLEIARTHQQSRERRPVPVQKRIVLGERGKRGLSTYVELFDAIATPNDVRINIAHNSTYVVAYGMDTDIEVVEALYASLVQQMVEASSAYIRSGAHKTETRWSEDKWDYVPVSGVTARISFQSAFSSRIRARLKDARAKAVQQATFHEDLHLDAEGQDAPAVATAEIVLKRKAEQVQDFYKKNSNARGSYRGWNRSSHSNSGARAGAAAGDRARIGVSRAIGGQKAALV